MTTYYFVVYAAHGEDDWDHPADRHVREAVGMPSLATDCAMLSSQAEAEKVLDLFDEKYSDTHDFKIVEVTIEELA